MRLACLLIWLLPTAAAASDPTEEARTNLTRLYGDQRDFFEEKGSFTPLVVAMRFDPERENLYSDDLSVT